MLVSTQTASFRKYGDMKKIIKLLKDAGFTAYDCSLGCEFKEPRNFLTKEEAKELRAYADEIGIVCNQTHAPYHSALVGDDAYNEAMLNAIIETVELSGILGAKICVVHPANDYTPEQNAELLYKKLEPHARKAGVKIAVENMWNWDYDKNQALKCACSHHENFAKHMSLLPEDVFVACLDLGHAEMRGLDTDCVQMIETLGKRIGCIHIHDNDLHDDTHDLPYLNKMDFNKIFATLKKVGYTGDVTFEENFNTHFPLEMYPACAKFLCELGNYFKDLMQ